jgi:hypothetical protein
MSTIAKRPLVQLLIGIILVALIYPISAVFSSAGDGFAIVFFYGPFSLAGVCLIIIALIDLIKTARHS